LFIEGFFENEKFFRSQGKFFSLKNIPNLKILYSFITFSSSYKNTITLSLSPYKLTTHGLILKIYGEKNKKKKVPKILKLPH